MDRISWLRERSLISEHRFDTLWAPIYDDEWGARINPTHLCGVTRLLALCPPHSQILDAACGTGKYWAMIRSHGFTLTGADQSQQMLRRAQVKDPEVPTYHMRLQDLRFRAAFDGIVCVDAMENVFPEDWPVVMKNFHQALRAGGHLYLTVELIEREELESAYEQGRQAGQPLIFGEDTREDGYHFYPPQEQVQKWLGEAQFGLIEEQTGDGYWHLLTQAW